METQTTAKKTKRTRKAQPKAQPVTQPSSQELDALRSEYRALRSGAYDNASAQEFDAACRKLAGTETPTPTQWVEAARQVRLPCKRCASTGRFITGSVNGQPTGPGGACFRCDGKGHQTREDERRNAAYDRYAAGRALKAMLG